MNSLEKNKQKNMTQEDKQLVFQDLCGRLPYGVFCNMGLDYPLLLQSLFVDKLDGILLDFYEDGKDYQVYLSEVKPYLRPMSSMTEEEREELKELTAADIVTNTGFGYKNLRGMCFGMMYLDCQEIIDWLNKKMFDFRGLIPKGLAISTEMFNPYYN
jgi:hypothetical protein